MTTWKMESQKRQKPPRFIFPRFRPSFLPCFLASVLLSFLASSLYAQDASLPQGTLTGIVREASLSRPIANATVSLKDALAITNEVGEFFIENLPAGSYDLRVEADGYEPAMARNTVVSSGRVVRVEIEMTRVSASKKLAPVRVEGQNLRRNPRVINSGQRMSRMEMQRAVGAAWDIQRIFASQPGAMASSDMTNNLVVRGGNPSENQIFIDHIETPNISHFAGQGETGGAIGLVNIDFVRDTEFYTGGFPAMFGGKLSSVMDIRLREGNRERTGGEVELSMAGFGGGLEGPLSEGKGSWLVSYRKSFLNLLREPARLEAIPHYDDAQAKAVYDLNPSHRLSFVGLLGREDVDIPWVRDVDRAKFDGLKGVAGATWLALLGTDAASRVTLSYVHNDYESVVWQDNPDPVYNNASVEREATLDFALDYGKSDRSAWQVGGFARWVNFRHQIDSEAWRGFSENAGRVVWLEAMTLDTQRNALRTAAFIHRDQALGGQVDLKLGLRAQHFTLTGAANLAPRIGLAWNPLPNTTLSLTGGLYYQPPTYIELTLNEQNLGLDDSQAWHAIAGFERRFSPTSRFRVEGYRKEYARVPIRKEETLESSSVYVNLGQKQVTGVDVLLEKRMEKGIFGSVVLSLSKSDARNAQGVWYPDDFDIRRMLAVTGGIPLWRDWQVSGKWRTMGGRPYTLFPVVEQPDGSYELVPGPDTWNNVRYPDYHRLDLRLDRRLEFGGWGTAFFIEVQNVYNRQNVFARQFDNESGTFRDILQFQRMLVLGMIADF